MAILKSDMAGYGYMSRMKLMIYNSFKEVIKLKASRLEGEFFRTHLRNLVISPFTEVRVTCRWRWNMASAISHEGCMP
jgi:hypothetical protein